MNATTTPTTDTTVAADLGRDWRLHAACASASVDPEIFYPIDPDPTGSPVTAARQVCSGCPVQPACLRDVMAGEDPARRWGITAGLTADERADLYGARRRTAANRRAVAA